MAGLLIGFGCTHHPEVAKPTRHDDGLPEFRTVEEAIAFVVQETNISKYQGFIAGSEEYNVDLPSGRTISNWVIDCYFRAAFHKFGKDVYPQLADLLNHKHEFVRVGTYAVLNHFMYSRGIRYNFRQDEADRLKAINQLNALLKKD